MGPWSGIRVIEMAGIGPAPFCGMLLADMGADVLRIDRAEANNDLGIPAADDPRFNLLNRGKRSVAIDLKHAQGPAAVLDLLASADVLIEGFRPGTMERLGLSPTQCHVVNPGLIYGRMTGWGQDGPAAMNAGHDINYIALSGALHAIGTADTPLPPLNLVGDYGGGAMFLAFGIASALMARARTGQGDVVDAAMVEGASYLMTPTYAMLPRGVWRDERAANILDGAAPWYGTFRTSDGKHMAVGAIEARFYKELLQGLGLDGELLPAQHERGGWPVLRERIAAAFLTRTQAEWTSVFATGDACVSPVLSMGEAPRHPHNRARANFIDVAGVTQPAPAPRFTHNTTDQPTAPLRPGQSGRAALLDWGIAPARVDALATCGAVRLDKEKTS